MIGVDFSRHDGLSLRGEPTEEDPDALVVTSLTTEDAGLLIRLRSRSTSRSRLGHHGHQGITSMGS